MFREMFNIFLDVAGKMHESYIFVAIVGAVMSVRKAGLEGKASLPFKSKADWLQCFYPTWNM